MKMKRQWRVLGLLLALFLNVGSVYAHVRLDSLINEGWHFKPFYEVTKKPGEKVNLPHTWNAKDGQSGELDYYRGMCTYDKKLTVPKGWMGKRIFLKFEGANTVTSLFINGKYVGEHRGGYTAFTFEITDKLILGKENRIHVKVNNAWQEDIMPLLGDFNMYGGIYRPVHILVLDPVCISPLDYSSPGVYLKQKSVTPQKAEVEINTVLSNGKDFPVEAKVRTRVFSKEGKEILKKETTKRVLGRSSDEVFQEVAMQNPHLWNGLKDPYLYSVTTELLINDRVVDIQKQPLGLRFFHVDPDKGFFLNGKHVELHGVCRHQDRQDKGNAISPKDHEEDLAIMREMGVNAIRLSHYPQAPYFYDLCNKEGVVLWSEIPFVGPGGYRDKGFINSPGFKANGRQQLKELIRQNYNHPSILFWGLFNELKEAGDNPVPFLKELHQLAHQEDPTRLTTGASNQGGDMNFITNLIAWNKYFGWYGGNPSQIGVWADKLHQQHPKLCIGISECGAGASTLHHEESVKKPMPNSMWHPEEWQALFHEAHWGAIKERPFMWGTFVWNMFDFGAAHRREGEQIGRNDKGLVTYDRKEKKEAFYFFKANWNQKDPFVHITGKRLKEKKQTSTTIKVYSNQDQVELRVNGRKIGKRKGENGIFVWKDVALKKGENFLEAVSVKRGKKISDKCSWIVKD